MNLNQITIPVHDVERSIAFYEKPGLKLMVKALSSFNQEYPDIYFLMPKKS